MVALFVLVTILAFLALDAAVEAARRRRAARAPGSPEAPVVPDDLLLADLAVTAGLFLHPGHTFVRLEPSGRALVGADALAARALGPVDGVELPPPGTEVNAGEPLFTLVKSGVRLPFRSPLSGEVLGARPPEPPGEPREPLVALRPRRLAEALRRLHVAEEAEEWIRGEAERLRGLLALHAPVPASAVATLPDGGVPLAGLLERRGPAAVAAFAREFLGAVGAGPEARP